MRDEGDFFCRQLFQPTDTTTFRMDSWLTPASLATRRRDFFWAAGSSSWVPPVLLESRPDNLWLWKSPMLGPDEVSFLRGTPLSWTLTGSSQLPPDSLPHWGGPKLPLSYPLSLTFHLVLFLFNFFYLHFHKARKFSQLLIPMKRNLNLNWQYTGWPKEVSSHFIVTRYIIYAHGKTVHNDGDI